jgi:uncharacterized membrane protein (DUF485 family)
MSSSHRRLAAARWRIAIVLTAAVICLYFGFIALIAYRKHWMGSLITRGLSVGILFGAIVIVASWLLTWYYVWWANNRYDGRLYDLKRREGI